MKIIDIILHTACIIQSVSQYYVYETLLLSYCKEHRITRAFVSLKSIKWPKIQFCRK